MQIFSNNDCIGVCSRTDNCMIQEIEIRNQAELPMHMIEEKPQE